MKYPLGTIGIVINDRKHILDDAVEFFSGGQGGHVFCVVGETKVFEMHCLKGAILRPLADYDHKSADVLMAAPLFINSQQGEALAVHLINMAKRKVKYDYKGILGHIFKIPNKINSRERYYCSEAVAIGFLDICNYYFMGLEPKVVTPYNMLFHVRSCQYDWESSFL